jgi:hypothetical protein
LDFKLKKNMNTKLSILLLFLITGSVNTISAQVTIGSNIPPDDNALLDLNEGKGDNGTISTKGLLFPRVELKATTDPFPLAKNVLGMIVYNTKANGSGTNVVEEGCYYNDGNKWIKMGSDNEGKLNDFWQAAAGWSIETQELRIYGKAVAFIVKLKRTGADTNVWNATNNPLLIAQTTTSASSYDIYKPKSTVGSINCLANFPDRTISTTAECTINSNGNIHILNVRESIGTFLNKGTLHPNDIIVVSGSYFIQ